MQNLHLTFIIFSLKKNKIRDQKVGARLLLLGAERCPPFARVCTDEQFQNC